MATLGSLIVEIGGEKRGLTQALLDAARETTKFTNDTGGTLTRASQRFAEITLGMAVKMEQQFARTTSRLRENLFRGVINKDEFQRQANEAAQVYNDSLTKMIDRLRRRKWLSEEDRQNLVAQYKDAGLRAGQALNDGIERGSTNAAGAVNRTAGAFERLRTRIGPASVAVIFGMEAMVRGAEAGESGIRTALRAIATAAAAFGPEGIVVAALVGFGIAAYENFSRARKEAEKTAREFAKSAADIARSGDIMRAAQLQQNLFSGDPFAAIEGQREKESNAQFIARAEGQIGLRKRIVDITKQELAFNERARAGAFSPQQMNALVWGKGGLAEQLKFRNELVEVLRIQDAQAAKAAAVFDIVNKKTAEESKHNLDRLREQSDKSHAGDLAGEGTKLAALWETLTTRHKATLAISNEILSVYDRLAARLKGMKDPFSPMGESIMQAMLALEKTGIIQLLRSAKPIRVDVSNIVDTSHPDRFPGLTPEARQVALNDESIRKLQEAITRNPPKPATLPAQAQIGRVDVIQARIGDIFDSIGNQLSGFFIKTFGPVALVMRILQPALDLLIPLLDALVRPLAMVAQVIAAGLEPAFRLLYPIIRALAIASTYVAQIFYNIAAAVTRFIGNLIIGFGNVVKAIATAIDKIPGINARGAIRAGEGIIRMGESMLDAADGFTKAANEMGNIRKRLNEMGWEEAKQGVDELGESARETANSLRNVPTWIRVNLEAWLAANVTNPATGPTAAAPGTIPPRGAAPPVRPMDGPTAPPAPPSYIPDGVQVSSISVAHVTVLAKDDPEQTWRDMLAAARRKAVAVYGDASRWSDLLEA